MAEPRQATDAQEAIDDFARVGEAVKERMARVVVGQHAAIDLLTTGLLCGGHMMLIGVPGLAKTLMVRVMARALGWEFKRIQFTPDLMPADITGTEILQEDETGRRRELVFQKGPIFANLILADEINRTPPKTQAALLEAMQERSVTVGGKTYPLSPPFVVVATQNPIEQEGTYPLPEAQLDRFLLSIHIEYPDEREELAIAGGPFTARIPELAPVSTAERFVKLIGLVDQVPVSDPVLAAAVALTAGSRPGRPDADDFVNKYVAWGAGPRATQHLVTAARARALASGRPSPEIDDVKAMAGPVLGHRIIVNYSALTDNVGSPDVIAHLLQKL